MEKNSYEGKTDEYLKKNQRTLSIILITVFVVFLVYLTYFFYRMFYLQLELEPVLVIGLIVIVGGMLPLVTQISTIREELKKRGVK